EARVHATESVLGERESQLAGQDELRSELEARAHALNEREAALAARADELSARVARLDQQAAERAAAPEAGAWPGEPEPPERALEACEAVLRPRESALQAGLDQ